MPELESYFATGGSEAAMEIGGPTPSQYTIEVRFMGGLTARQKAAFKGAADRWTRAIVGDLPAVTVDGERVDDLLILAQGGPIDGPGQDPRAGRADAAAADRGRLGGVPAGEGADDSSTAPTSQGWKPTARSTT